MKKYSSDELRPEKLYRKRASLVLFAGLLAIASWFSPLESDAQRKKQSGPRAIAVVTWNGDDPSPTLITSVLTPVAILVEGRYYDAELYQTQPVPLAVDSGVIYDVLKNGEPVGTFTLGGARERDGVWYGTGVFDKKAATTAKETKPALAKPAATGAAADERPHLRRGTPPPPAPKEQTDAVLKNIDLDPQRPTLRRHSAEEKKAESQSSIAPKEFVPPEMHRMVAVSDSSGPEPHSFVFHSKTGEAQQVRAAMEKMTQAELNKLRKPPARSENKEALGKKERFHGPTSWLPLPLQDAKFGVFDVNANNAPIVVYSANAMVDGEKKYITVAAWEEIDESLRKVFVQVTDDHHLDVYPRLEVIDAVDAAGNGRGELLFRAFGDQGSRFVLYHPGPDSLNLLFDSSRGESGR